MRCGETISRNIISHKFQHFDRIDWLHHAVAFLKEKAMNGFSVWAFLLLIYIATNWFPHHSARRNGTPNQSTIDNKFISAAFFFSFIWLKWNWAADSTPFAVKSWRTSENHFQRHTHTHSGGFAFRYFSNSSIKIVSINYYLQWIMAFIIRNRSIQSVSTNQANNVPWNFASADTLPANITKIQ